MIYVLLFINAILLVLTYIPGIGSTSGGATRWLSVGGVFKIQPSELTKLLLVIYFAYVINHKKDKIKMFSTGFVPYVTVSSLFILLILFQPDFGTAFILGFVMLIMLFIGGSKKAYIISSMIAVMPLMYFAVMSSSYRKRRIIAFMNPWADPQDSGFQIIQSQIAFFSGGITGKGLGDGQQKLFYLPEAHTDFIFAVLAEELGFIGVFAILGVYVFLIFRGFLVAFRSQDSLGTLLAFGITSLLGFQIIFNIGVVMGVFPTKGIALPFLSYGGASLIVTLTMIGILLNISAQNKIRNS
jgi:cell division protein FtsW